MPRLELPDESEIRALVGRVVDAMEQPLSQPVTPAASAEPKAGGAIAVGAAMSVSSPSAMWLQPMDWGSVGPSVKVRSNQAWTAG